MVKVDVDGKMMELDVDGVDLLDFYRTAEKHLSIEELMNRIPELVSLGITADKIADGVPTDRKVWDVYQVLVKNGLSVQATRSWYGSNHKETAKDIGWLFRSYIDNGYQPDVLAMELSDFLSKEALNVKGNAKILIDIGVKADLLVKIMTKNQIGSVFELLIRSGANIDLIIDAIGVYPKFYQVYPIKELLKIGANPLLISKYAFYPTQPYDVAESYLNELYSNGLNLSEFVSQVVIAGKTALHIVVHFASFFVERYINVRSVLRDADAEKNKLVILANFSELEALGVIDEPQKTKKRWKKEVGLNAYDIVFDSHGYDYEYLIHGDDYEYLIKKEEAAQ